MHYILNIKLHFQTNIFLDPTEGFNPVYLSLQKAIFLSFFHFFSFSFIEFLLSFILYILSNSLLLLKEIILDHLAKKHWYTYMYIFYNWLKGFVVFWFITSLFFSFLWPLNICYITHFVQCPFHYFLLNFLVSIYFSYISKELRYLWIHPW